MSPTTACGSRDVQWVKDGGESRKEVYARRKEARRAALPPDVSMVVVLDVPG